ncbi:MAG TPA: hypothetical protein VLA98_09310 [Solirubrobacteraceae bacterium]|nr:hypothetical protein [Solirubrobacteraceae bacterium]
MARRLVGALTRALRTEWHEPPVHFHAGPQGRPVVCEREHCTRPHLDPAEARAA